MELPDLVPEMEFRPRYDGDVLNHFFLGNITRLVPREEATRSLVSFLNSILLMANATTTNFSFETVYFETASISALQQNLDRLFEEQEEGSLLGHINFDKCNGAVEMAICVASNSKCQHLVLEPSILQRLPFTPALAEAFSRSTSLATLIFEDNQEPGELVLEVLTPLDMERLSLCLCTNSSIQVLRFNISFKGDESMVAFVKHLPGMSNLRSLWLGGNEFSEAGERALIKVLEGEDHSLEELRLVGKPTSLQNYVDFLLWLKKNGDRKAISSSTPMKLIELLARFRGDPSALYFTLCSDPGRFKNL
jgi:hypothetical protein